jgi:peroxiredoxin
MNRRMSLLSIGLCAALVCGLVLGAGQAALGEDAAKTVTVTGKAALSGAKKGADLKVSQAQGMMVSELKREPIPYPKNFAAMSNTEKRAWINDWIKTEEGMAYRTRMQKAYQNRKMYKFTVNEDGSFKLDKVENGNYTLQIAILKGREPIAQFSKAVVVKGEDVSIGDVTLAVSANLGVGDEAPNFVTKTVDGKELSLSDFKGKYVLIDFWATWCGPCRGETPNLKATFEKYRSNPKFAMIGMSLDKDGKLPKAYADKNGLEWVNAHPGPSDPVAKAFGVRGIPSIWLIGPDGKVVAKGLRGAAIPATIEKHLNQSK